MTVAALRGLFEAAMARGAVIPGMETVETEAPRARGFAYVCRQCDVYGYLGPDDPAVCWACEESGNLDRR